jgi:hypothetical protein
MLPKIHSLAYNDLLKEIQELYSSTNISDLDTALLLSKFQEVQQLFNERVVTITDEDLEGQSLHQWQPLQTEIHRSLRLLFTDLMLLRSSRQSKTLTHRLATVRQRLEQLMAYCQQLTH